MRVRTDLLCIATAATLVVGTTCVRSLVESSPDLHRASDAATRTEARPFKARRSSATPAVSEGYSLPAGIHDAVEEPPGYGLSNYWSNGAVGDEVLEVFAGNSDELGSGVLVFDVWVTRFYPTPSKSVGLRIQDRRGQILILLDRAGRRFQFDTLSRTLCAPTRMRIKTIVSRDRGGSRHYRSRRCRRTSPWSRGDVRVQHEQRSRL